MSCQQPLVVVVVMLLMLLLLWQPAEVSASVPPSPAPPPPPSPICIQTLFTYCDAARLQGDYACGICAGTNAKTLHAAGCDDAYTTQFCHNQTCVLGSLCATQRSGDVFACAECLGQHEANISDWCEQADKEAFCSIAVCPSPNYSPGGSKICAAGQACCAQQDDPLYDPPGPSSCYWPHNETCCACGAAICAAGQACCSTGNMGDDTCRSSCYSPNKNETCCDPGALVCTGPCCSEWGPPEIGFCCSNGTKCFPTSGSGSGSGVCCPIGTTACSTDGNGYNGMCKPTCGPRIPGCNCPGA